MEQELFREMDLLTFSDKLFSLTKRYDEADEESETIEFSQHDPLKNPKRALVDLLREQTEMSLFECEKAAQEIFSEIEVELKSPNVKSRLCASLRIISNDFSTLNIGVATGIILNLFTVGIITLPLSPVVIVSIGTIIISRMGIAFVCADS